MFATARRLIAAAGLLAVLAAAPARAADCTPGSAWGTDRPLLAAEVVRLVNEHRAGLGLPPLATSPTLTAAATWKSLHMASGGAVDHDDPTRSWYQRIRDCGYPANAAVGENIAAGHRTAREVMDGWLASPGHRANIEYAGFAAIGVGAAADARGVLFWTQDFGSVVDAVAAPPQPAPPPVVPPPPAAAPLPAQAAPTARCRRTRGRRIRCWVADGTVVRARLVRRGRILARAGAKLMFRPSRALPAGRYVLVARLSERRWVRITVRLGARGRTG